MWRAITEEDVLEGLSQSESDAFRLTQSVSEIDPLPGIITSGTRKIREAIRSWRDNRLHEDESFVPDGCIMDAVPIIRHRLLSKLDMEISDPRTLEYKEANAYLRDIRAGRVAIEKPDQDPTAAAPTPSPHIRAPRRRFSRHQQDGI